VPAAGTPADPASALFPAGWRQGWVRGLEGRTLRVALDPANGAIRSLVDRVE
jgi:hypothetical protein